MKAPIYLKEHGKTKMVAHRGLSGIETENTLAAFIAAGNRGYYGTETDIYRTNDGHYICNHDGMTHRICNEQLVIEESSFDSLRALVLNDLDGNPRADLRLCTPMEYLSVCKTYGLVAVTELKSDFTEKEISELVSIFSDYLENTIFISFIESNLDKIKAILPEQHCQLLSGEWDDSLPARMEKKGMGLDICSGSLSAEAFAALKSHGVEVNCWTVDDVAEAERLIALGVDQITTNILL